MAEPSAYPPLNPFPLQATASVEATGTPDNPTASTVFTPQLLRAWEQASRYLTSVATDTPNAAGVMAVYGAAGTGKTHTLRYLYGRATQEAAAAKRTIGVAYVLPGSADVDAIRFMILRQISRETLQAVGERFLGTIGREFVDASTATTDAGREQQQRLRSNLPQITELIRSALIDPEEVTRRQGQELREAGNNDFRNAFSYIDDRELGPAAHAWLCGEDLDQQTLLRLGVSKDRASDHGHRALRVVVQLFKRTQTPLIVLIDQCETVLRPVAGQPLQAAGLDLFQRLVELLPKERAFLGLALNHDVWKDLPDYLKQRFSPATIELSVISMEVATTFIHLYVHRMAPQTGERPKIDPFDEVAVKEILADVRGNLRGFLQTCHEAFRLAAPTSSRITVDVVRQALINSSRQRPTLPQVVGQIDAIVRDRALELQALIAPPSTSRRLSYVIQPRGGLPMARLEVSESLFTDDEARQSITTADVVRRAREEALPVLVVVVGYASPEILHRLKELSPHVIVYEPEYLRARIIEVLDGITISAPAPVSLASADLAKLRDELVALLQSREGEAKRTSSESAEVLQRAEQSRNEDIWRRTRADWLTDRRQLEGQIKEARRIRLTEELETLEWDRVRAQRERLQRVLLGWGGAGVIGACYAVWFLQRIAYEPSSIMPSIVTAGFVPVAIALLAGLVQIYGVPGAIRTLWQRVRSIEELNELAARLGRTRHVTVRQLKSANPQLRYAAVVNAKMALSPSPFARILLGASIGPQHIHAAAEVEQNSTVRRAMARRVGVSIVDMVRPAWPEAAYGFYRTGLAELVQWVDRSGRLGLVHAVLTEGPAGEAYRRGITPENWSELLQDLGQAQLQAILVALSPIERPGLGTLDHLAQIGEIDSMYLFFRQCQFFLDRDVPSERPFARAIV